MHFPLKWLFFTVNFLFLFFFFVRTHQPVAKKVAFSREKTNFPSHFYIQTALTSNSLSLHRMQKKYIYTEYVWRGGRGGEIKEYNHTKNFFIIILL